MNHICFCFCFLKMWPIKNIQYKMRTKNASAGLMVQKKRIWKDIQFLHYGHYPIIFSILISAKNIKTKIWITRHQAAKLFPIAKRRETFFVSYDKNKILHSNYEWEVIGKVFRDLILRKLLLIISKLII